MIPAPCSYLGHTREECYPVWPAYIHIINLWCWSSHSAHDSHHCEKSVVLIDSTKYCTHEGWPLLDWRTEQLIQLKLRHFTSLQIWMLSGIVKYSIVYFVSSCYVLFGTNSKLPDRTWQVCPSESASCGNYLVFLWSLSGCSFGGDSFNDLYGSSVALNCSRRTELNSLVYELFQNICMLSNSVK